MELKGPGTDAATKVCAQCGRIGVRGYTVWPAEAITIGGRTHPVGEMIVCTNQTACLRRWPQKARDDD